VEPEPRRLTPDDLAACAEVFYLAMDDLQAKRGLAALPRNAPALDLLFRHIVTIDPDRAWLAEEDGSVVGFGMGTRREELDFLSFLFVRPDAQGHGVGRQLLRLCLPASPYRGTCIEAIQPVSGGLYARYGLVPRVPIYTLIGQPKVELPDLGPEVEVRAMAEMPVSEVETLFEAVATLDAEVAGFRRPADHRAWQLWGRQGFLLRAAGEPVGYGYAQPSGRLGPVVVRDSALLLPFVGRLMREVTATDAWQLLAPGPADETFVALLNAGMRFDGPPAIFCATRPGPDYTRYLPASYALP
jgi:GNAT superfamily N-acetyltransferase